jgi:mono/diheme cytochrome c family protein
MIDRVFRSKPSRLAAGMVALAGVVGLTACGPEGPDAALTLDSALDRGAEVYAESCASCHGLDLRGTDKGPSHLSIIYEPNHHSDDSFRSAIANGAPQHHWRFGHMDPVQGLSQDDIEAVIGYVRAEQQLQGFES